MKTKWWSTKFWEKVSPLSCFSLCVWCTACLQNVLNLVFILAVGFEINSLNNFRGFNISGLSEFLTCYYSTIVLGSIIWEYHVHSEPTACRFLMGNVCLHLDFRLQEQIFSKHKHCPFCVYNVILIPLIPLTSEI